ncbi:MAG: hypothetical protein U9O63_04510, partial [Actinomycetota bacterium]|nr:hypothetical protein [Actinomycetota bacterium]
EAVLDGMILQIRDRCGEVYGHAHRVGRAQNRKPGWPEKDLRWRARNPRLAPWGISCVPPP